MILSKCKSIQPFWRPILAVAIKIINAIDIKDHSRWSIILNVFIILNKVEPY